MKRQEFRKTNFSGQSQVRTQNDLVVTRTREGRNYALGPVPPLEKPDLLTSLNFSSPPTLTGNTLDSQAERRDTGGFRDQ